MYDWKQLEMRGEANEYKTYCLGNWSWRTISETLGGQLVIGTDTAAGAMLIKGTHHGGFTYCRPVAAMDDVELAQWHDDLNPLAVTIALAQNMYDILILRKEPGHSRPEERMPSPPGQVTTEDRMESAREWNLRGAAYFSKLGIGCSHHRQAIDLLVADCHDAAKAAGWWSNADGSFKDRNDGEMIALMHSELSEMLEGVRKDSFDDHLPHRSSVEVELADLLIRAFDFAGARDLDIGGAYIEKRAYNAVRPDHKREARDAQGGKKF
mgnify:CR=1 FL=1